MQEVLGKGTVAHSARTVGGGVVSHVIGAHREASHLFPQRRDACGV